MKYSFLGEDLHEAADKAKAWFTSQYGARQFKREEEVLGGLPLRPTWQAILRTGYKLCINVQPTPFSPTLHEFVNESARLGLPIKLWVAVGEGGAKDSFGAELKQARNIGIGVVQIPSDAAPHEYHRAVPLSLFALARTDLARVPKPRREVFKNAEDTFLDGAPDQGCQAICQELELISREFAETTYKNGWWKSPSGSSSLPSRFFTKDSWAEMLEALERRGDTQLIAPKSAKYSKHVVVKTRAFTDWRNAVSHKPKSLGELKARDAKLRTMFEATRNLLVEWYEVAKPLGLVK
jgi:hypothetical protein